MARRLTARPRHRGHGGGALDRSVRIPDWCRRGRRPRTMIVLAALAGVYVLMIVEWRLSLAHERVLRAAGAYEPPGDVHHLMAWAYPSTFMAMAIEGALSGPPASSVIVAGTFVFVAAKALKVWAIA